MKLYKFFMRLFRNKRHPSRVLCVVCQNKGISGLHVRQTFNPYTRRSSVTMDFVTCSSCYRGRKLTQAIRSDQSPENILKVVRL